MSNIFLTLISLFDDPWQMSPELHIFRLNFLWITKIKRITSKSQNVALTDLDVLKLIS